MELLDLPAELIPRYALNLNLGEIFHLCSVNKEFNQEICANEHFWKMKFIHDYHLAPNYTGSWRKLYQNYNSVWSFGYNRDGQLGLGDQRDRLTPTLIPQPKAELRSDFSRPPAGKTKAISAGFNRTVLIDLEDNVWSFGYDLDGQLRLGDDQDRTIPTLIPQLKAKAISDGRDHTVLIATLINS